MHEIRETFDVKFMLEIFLDNRLTKFHGHQSMKLQLSYKMMFGYVQKLQILHVIPLKTINIVSYKKFYQPKLGRAGLVRFLG